MSSYFELLQIFFGALIVGFSGALVPGPMFTLVITRVAQKGFAASVFIVIGHALTELLVLILFAFGILKYLNNEIVIKVIGIAGGIALLLFAADLFYSVFKRKVILDLKTNPNEKTDLNKGKNAAAGIFQGMIVSLINPYWYVWWVTIGAAFLIKSLKYKFTGSILFYIGHISSDFIWYLALGFILSKSKKFFSQKVYRIILIICGVFLIYLGIKFIVDFSLRQS